MLISTLPKASVDINSSLPKFPLNSFRSLKPARCGNRRSHGHHVKKAASGQRLWSADHHPTCPDRSSNPDSGAAQAGEPVNTKLCVTSVLGWDGGQGRWLGRWTGWEQLAQCTVKNFMSIRDSSLMLHHSSTSNHLSRQDGYLHQLLQGPQPLVRVTSGHLVTGYKTGEGTRLQPAQVCRFPTVTTLILVCIQS